MHAIETAEESGFSTTAWPNNRSHGIRRDVQRHIINHALLPVPDRKILNLKGPGWRRLGSWSRLGIPVDMLDNGWIRCCHKEINHSQKKLDDRCGSSASENSYQYVNAKDPGDEDERAGPSLPMPIVIRRNCVGKNLQRQRRDRLGQIVVPKTVPESGEKERRGLAADARQCQQNASNDSLGGSLHHHMHNRFPTAYPESKRGFTIPVWHQQNDFFCCADNQRNHDQPKREPTGVTREALQTQHHQSINYHPPGDRRDTI